MHPCEVNDLSRNAKRVMLETLAEIGPTKTCSPCAYRFLKYILAEIHAPGSHGKRKNSASDLRHVPLNQCWNGSAVALFMRPMKNTVTP